VKDSLAVSKVARSKCLNSVVFFPADAGYNPTNAELLSY